MVPSGQPNMPTKFELYSCNSIAMRAFFVEKYIYFLHFSQFWEGKYFPILVKFGTEASSGSLNDSVKFQAHSYISIEMRLESVGLDFGFPAILPEM